MNGSFPPEVVMELPGWSLEWIRLASAEDHKNRLDHVWDDEHETLRARFEGRKLTDDAVVTAVRTLFRQAGTDPTRYRPSSEALARRVLRGDVLPRINTNVDINNLLSLRLLVPCCVVNAARVEAPFVLRAGVAGERMLSMRGDFALEGKVLLEDKQGPFGTPVTDSERVKVSSESDECWMVAYLPEGHGGSPVVEKALENILGGTYS